MQTIIILLLLFLQAGCNSFRKLTESMYQISINRTITDTRTEQTGSYQKQSDELTLTNIRDTGDIEIESKEYDTTQPVNATTEMSPLKKETIIRHRAEKEIRQEQATKSYATGTDSTVITDYTKYDTNTAIRTEGKRTRNPSWWLCLTISGILLVIFKIRKRWMQRE